MRNGFSHGQVGKASERLTTPFSELKSKGFDWLDQLSKRRRRHLTAYTQTL